MNKNLKASIKNATLKIFSTDSVFENVDENVSLGLIICTTSNTRMGAYADLLQKEYPLVKFNYDYLYYQNSKNIVGFKITFTGKDAKQ